MEDRIKIDAIADCKDFWLYFLGTIYINAYNEETDTSLSEYILENYDISTDWINNFTKYYDGVMEKSDGYLENPRVLEISLAENNLLEIAFHPGETVFILNKKEMGCSGPHPNWKRLQWLEICSLVDQTDYSACKFQLLLPMCCIDEIQEIEIIKTAILSSLGQLPFYEKDIETITAYLCSYISKS